MLALLRGDPSADSTVPPSGATGHLTTLAAAAMALLALIAIAAAQTAGRVADDWAGALDGAATLEIAADPATAETAAERALMILRETPGIDSARRIGADEARALLAPWMGDTSMLADADLPLMLAVEEAPELDRAALELRLAGEFDDAVYLRHDRWSGTVTAAAGRLRLLALGALALTFVVTAAVVTLAARAALAMNRPVIATLRLIGAQDSYIARAFVRRFTLRTLLGAALGTGAGTALLLALASGGALPAAAPTGPAGWLALLAVPPAFGLLAFAATRAAAFHELRRVR
ncbi:cell division protein FtsX [Rhodobacteraceae bacterium 2CG4]|uniref:Cell division protein FtsX n=2 Tax=Halovulum marinum TaxID=2662447 RepID=A0A6L5YWC7_9RHOB|nr:cell division protein FtsX [Halovulum marinum]